MGQPSRVGRAPSTRLWDEQLVPKELVVWLRLLTGCFVFSGDPPAWPVGMVLEGSSESLCPPPSLELRPSCNKSQATPPLGSSSQPHDGLFPEDKEPVKYGELIVLG